MLASWKIMFPFCFPRFRGPLVVGGGGIFRFLFVVPFFAIGFGIFDISDLFYFEFGSFSTLVVSLLLFPFFFLISLNLSSCSLCVFLGTTAAANPTPRLLVWVWWMRIPHSRGNSISLHGPAIPGPLRGHLTLACLVSLSASNVLGFISRLACNMPGKLSYFCSSPAVQFVSYLHYISRTGMHGKHHRPDLPQSSHVSVSDLLFG